MEIEVIQNKIFEIRGCKVMLDFDLALLYNVDFTENIAGVFLAIKNIKILIPMPPNKIIILALFNLFIILFINSLLVTTVNLYILEVMLLQEPERVM